MDFIEFTCGINDSNRRIDKVIRIFAKHLSLSQIYKGLRKGLIKVNNKKVQQDHKVNSDDKIQIASFLLEQIETTNQTKKDLFQENMLPEIIFQNEHIIIFNKPRGLNVQKSKKDEISLDEIVKNFYEKKKSNDSLSFVPGPLHRLDKNTTGLVTFSMSIEGARWFSKNIQNHNIKKKYRGIVENTLIHKEEWNDLIKKNDNSEKFKTVLISKDDGKNAITIVTPLKSLKINNNELTYVEYDIKTGRQHQIRAQSSKHNFPLFGDTSYGGKSNSHKHTFYLHAYELSFPKNELGIPEKIIAPLPKDFSDFINNFL